MGVLMLEEGIWIDEEMYRLMQKFDYDMAWAWTPQPFIDKEENHVKLALVDGNRMIGVHNETMAGYELQDDVPMIKLPLVPTTYTTFNRWATGFDV